MEVLACLWVCLSSENGDTSILMLEGSHSIPLSSGKRPHWLGVRTRPSLHLPDTGNLSSGSYDALLYA